MSGYRLGAPEYAWLLAAIALLLPLVVWRVALWRRDVRAVARHRLVPVRERFRAFGPWPFWGCLLAALAPALAAVARPQARIARVRTAVLGLPAGGPCPDRRRRGAAPDAHRPRPHGRRGSDRPAGWIGVDARPRRRRHPVAATDAVPADDGGIAGLERRPDGARRVRPD